MWITAGTHATYQSRTTMGGCTTPREQLAPELQGGRAKDRKPHVAISTKVYLCRLRQRAPLSGLGPVNPQRSAFSTKPQSISANSFGCSCNGAGSTTSVSAAEPPAASVLDIGQTAASYHTAEYHAYEAASVGHEALRRQHPGGNTVAICMPRGRRSSHPNHTPMVRSL